MRRRFTRSSGKRKRAIWVNVPFSGVAFTETVGSQVLMVPEDWEAQFSGNAAEKCVLRAVRGEITWQQTSVGTAGTTGFWGLYVSGTAESGTAMTAWTQAGMSKVDWLRTGAFGISTSVTTSLTSALQARLPIDVKAKRRLTSRDSITICAGFASDAASPGGVLGGILRFLVARD